jgi:hypothetical protein
MRCSALCGGLLPGVAVTAYYQQAWLLHVLLLCGQHMLLMCDFLSIQAALVIVGPVRSRNSLCSLGSHAPTAWLVPPQPAAASGGAAPREQIALAVVRVRSASEEDKKQANEHPKPASVLPTVLQSLRPDKVSALPLSLSRASGKRVLLKFRLPERWCVGVCCPSLRVCYWLRPFEWKIARNMANSKAGTALKKAGDLTINQVGHPS